MELYHLGVHTRAKKETKTNQGWRYQKYTEGNKCRMLDCQFVLGQFVLQRQFSQLWFYPLWRQNIRSNRAEQVCLMRWQTSRTIWGTISRATFIQVTSVRLPVVGILWIILWSSMNWLMYFTTHANIQCNEHSWSRNIRSHMSLL